MTSRASHQPVLLDEIIDNLSIKTDGTYIDCTLGGGGYSRAILGRLSGRGQLIALDCDEEAVAAANAEFGSFGNFKAVQANFREIGESVGRTLGLRVDGIVADLGLSSIQLDDKNRGFSHRFDGPLDMRFGNIVKGTAENILREYSFEQLRHLFFEYGQERQAGPIARTIVGARDKYPTFTTGTLVELVAKHSHPAALNKTLSRIFQALRIEVNQELDNLSIFLDQALKLLNRGGRIVVVTYHSLEDRLVKHRFRDWATPSVSPETGQPLTDPSGRVVTKRPIIATENEITSNSRSRSAKLRTFEAFS